MSIIGKVMSIVASPLLPVALMSLLVVANPFSYCVMIHLIFGLTKAIIFQILSLFFDTRLNQENHHNGVNITIGHHL